MTSCVIGAVGAWQEMLRRDCSVISLITDGDGAGIGRCGP
jgi:hypothetical protein